MAKPKSAETIAAKLREVKAKASQTSTAALETPAKGVVNRATGSFTLQVFGGMNIPVQTLKATDSDKIDTHMYHSETCVHSLKQSYHCEFCNEKVENARKNALRGVEVGDKIIFITEDEIVKAKPASDKVLKITEFIPLDSIDILYYESTDYIAPEQGKGGDVPFATLRNAMAKRRRVAIGTLVSRGHQYTVAIRPYGQNGMAMSYLYADYEVRTCGKWTSVQTNPEEEQLIEILIDETELAKDKFTPAQYDPYLANMREVIRKKMNGEVPQAGYTEETVKPTGGSMLDLLKATLAQQKAKAKAA